MNRHCDTNELQGHLDRTLESVVRAEVEEHLNGCPRCREALSSLRALDRALRSMPTEQLDARFTRAVMSTLALGQADTLTFKILEKLSYVFALFVVLALMITAFVASGVVGEQEVSDGQTKLHELVSSSATQLGHFIEFFSRTLAAYAPFAFGTGSLGLTGAICVVVVLLALVDRFLVRRFVH